MASLEQMQAERQQIIGEIQRRGGKDKAPGFAAKLAALDQQISAAKQQQQQAPQPPQGPVNPEGQGAGVPPGMPQDPSLKALGKNALQAAYSNLEGSNLGQTFNPEVMDRASNEDIAAQRKATEDALFASLTRNVDSQQAQEQEQLSQTLRNRGIPVGSDLYNQQMQQFNDRYDTIRSNARNSASVLGLQELQGLTDAQEQIINNQYGQAAGVRNQQIGEIGALTGLDQMAKDYALNKKKTAAEIAALGQVGNTGGGAAPSPFYNTPPPGL